MAKLVLKFQMEIYTVFTAVIVILGFCGVYSLTTPRKLVLGIVVIGVFHEWEEKRIPGGFFEKVGALMGWNLSTVDVRKPGIWVLAAWLIVGYVPLIFPDVHAFILMPMVLGIFEMIIHTAGKKICHIKGWYFPGIITAWIMGLFSVFSIVNYSSTVTLIWTDVLGGIACMAAVYLFLQVMGQKAAGSSLPKMIAHMTGKE